MPVMFGCSQPGFAACFSSPMKHLSISAPSLDFIFPSANMASTSAAADFHAVFHGQKNRELRPWCSYCPLADATEIEEILAAPGTKASEVSTALTALKKDYAAVMGALPSYDQRQYDMVRHKRQAQQAQADADIRP